VRGLSVVVSHLGDCWVTAVGVLGVLGGLYAREILEAKVREIAGLRSRYGCVCLVRWRWSCVFWRLRQAGEQ
jgi:hypothetical protein